MNDFIIFNDLEWAWKDNGLISKLESLIEWNIIISDNQTMK